MRPEVDPLWAKESEWLALAALEEPVDERMDEYRELCFQQDEKFLSLKSGLDPKDLGQAGWGLIVPESLPFDALKALKPLLDWRCGETGDSRPRLFTYKDGESGMAFLSRNGLSPGPVDPSRVPYYLLVVGPPSSIPFEFQQYLSVKHAVGRVDFERPADYRRYADHVVRCEQEGGTLDKRLGLFGPSYDPATRQSNRYLLHPLKEHFDTQGDWAVDTFLADQARKETHLELVAGESPPAFLLSVCHGLSMPVGHPRQRVMQGAQLCQPLERSQGNGRSYLAGDDIDLGQPGARGQILFMNGCFSAGTPHHNAYAFRGQGEVPICAPKPFTAYLPQRLLAQEEGALAVIGHVDRTWTYSFRWPGPSLAQTAVFESAAMDLMQGHRVGAAIEKSFGQRFAELSVRLADLQEECRFGMEPGLGLKQIWTARNDARSMLILGDPAVRLSIPLEAKEPSAPPSSSALPS